VCLVSIVRSGDILQEAVRCLRPGLSVGKILIQRDESRYYKYLTSIQRKEIIKIQVDEIILA
jgi:uracil phosphoribosyltransferase